MQVALLDAAEAARQLERLADARRSAEPFDFKRWLRAERKRLYHARLEAAARKRGLQPAPAPAAEAPTQAAGAQQCEGPQHSSGTHEAALWWWQCAAKQGHVPARYWLGVLYERIYGLSERALQQWETAAAAGYGPALFTLGTHLLHGQADVPRGLELLRRGAASHAPCAFWYGYVHHASAPSHGLQRDDRTALEYIRAAADMGDGAAQHYLAMALASGDGVAADARQSRHWLERAAAAHHPDALYVLACELAGATSGSPDGSAAHELDLPRARQLFEAAARLGHVDALCALGAMCYRGLGGQRDPQAAFYAYQSAALRDHPAAARNLADLFERGEGVPASPDNARFWRARADALQQQHEAAGSQ